MRAHCAHNAAPKGQVGLIPTARTILNTKGKMKKEFSNRTKFYRKICSFLSKMNVPYPIKNATLAVSGGSDSVFLTHLLLSFDNKLVDKSTAKILHINHNWRDEESLTDQLFVQSLGKQFGVPVETFQVYPDKSSKESPELLARNQRKEIFSKFENILTGHTADDLFETVLWKTLQGRDPGIGIKVFHANEIRLLLQFTKSEMQSYLIEIGQNWREDPTNHDGILLRSKMRKDLLPTLAQVFPDSKMAVVKKSLEKQVSDNMSCRNSSNLNLNNTKSIYSLAVIDICSSVKKTI